MIVTALGSQIGAAGLPTAVAYSIAGNHISARVVLRVVMRTWVALSLSAALSCAGAVGLLFRGRAHMTVVIEAALVAVLVASAMSWTLLLSCLQGEHHFGRMNLLRPLASLLAAASLLGWLLTKRRASVSEVLIVLVVVNVVSCIVGGIVVARACRIDHAAANVTAKKLLSYGLASLAGGSQTLDSLSIDQAAVGVLLSHQQLGLYVVGSAFNNLPSILLHGIGTVALPRIAGESDPGARLRLMKRILRLSILSAALVTVAVELVVPFLLPLAFGSAYAAAVPVARLLIVAGFFLALRRILVVFLQAVGRPGQTGVGEVAGAATLAVLAFLLVPRLGLSGAGISLGLGAIAADLYLTFALRRSRSGAN